MTYRLTIQELDKLKKAGKIRGYSAVCGKTSKQSKYKNQRVLIDGMVFDSKKEGRRYVELRMLQTAGEISDLRCQVPYELNEGGSHSLKYVADFVYLLNGEVIVEDVKGYRTREYKRKRTLMKTIYNIEIKEI
jgi:hypothetical protein